VAERRSAQKEATKSRILEAARLHFERDGFDTASIRDIANQAGVAAGTVLLHFGDKASLLHAALHDDLETAIAHSLAAPSEGPLLSQLCAVARPFYAYYEARPRLSHVLLRESLLAESPWKERFAAQAQRVVHHVSALVEQARARGEVDPKLQPMLLATAFASFYYFVLIGWVQQGVAAPMPLFEALMAQQLAPYTSTAPTPPAAPSLRRRRK
jgi:AcrR family transcriptional regulator